MKLADRHPFLAVTYALVGTNKVPPMPSIKQTFLLKMLERCDTGFLFHDKSFFRMCYPGECKKDSTWTKLKEMRPTKESNRKLVTHYFDHNFDVI